MAGIGIVGAGTAGLHLALKLQSHGVPVTLYAEHDPEWYRTSGRLPATVAHHAPTHARERSLKVDHWYGPNKGLHYARVNVVAGPQSFGFRGRMDTPSTCVDYRLYQPTLAADFVARGGELKVLAVDPAALERLSTGHDLMVVSTGRGGLSSLFPRIPELSPHTQPPRKLFACLVSGITFADAQEPHTMGVNLVPGQGEIFESVMTTRTGFQAALFFEAIPGSELEVLSTQRYEDDPRGFTALLLDRLRRFAPSTYERVDPAHFGILGPTDYLQGAFTPTVRQGWRRLGNGRHVMAVGDAHVSNDPVAGQGANAGSAAAFALAQSLLGALSAGLPLDEAFCREAEKRTWGAMASATLWTNAMLQPPPPHMIDLLVAGARDQRVADGFVTSLMSADAALSNFASPEGTAAYVARLTGLRASQTGIKRVA
jgi:hypothetical protein